MANNLASMCVPSVFTLLRTRDAEPEPEPEPPEPTHFGRSRSRSRSRRNGLLGAGAGAVKNGAAPAPKRDTIVEKLRNVKGTNPALKKPSNIPEIYAKMFGRFH